MEGISERCFIHSFLCLFAIIHPSRSFRSFNQSIIHSFIHSPILPFIHPSMSFIRSSRSLTQFTCACDDWEAPPPLALRLKEF